MWVSMCKKIQQNVVMTFAVNLPFILVSHIIFISLLPISYRLCLSHPSFHPCLTHTHHDTSTKCTISACVSFKSWVMNLSSLKQKPCSLQFPCFENSYHSMVVYIHYRLATSHYAKLVLYFIQISISYYFCL